MCVVSDKTVEGRLDPLLARQESQETCLETIVFYPIYRFGKTYQHQHLLGKTCNWISSCHSFQDLQGVTNKISQKKKENLIETYCRENVTIS